MVRTNVERVDESVAYIKKNIGADLAEKFKGINKEQAGAQISLKGHYYMPVGWDEQHKAVRALLLCQYKFLDQFAMAHQSKTFFKSKSKEDVNKYIFAYAKENPTLEELAKKAENYSLNTGQLGWYQRNREDNNVGGSAIICYTGVLLWLFQAGFVTLKWFMDNNNMNANNCNAILGAGVQVNIEDMNEIPRGWIWNFQGYRKEICHWGISLGEGRAAGTNNTEEAETKEGKGVKVEFEPGGELQYGKFTLRSQYEVLKLKYDSTSVRDPSGGVTDFTTIDGVETKLFKINPSAIVF